MRYCGWRNYQLKLRLWRVSGLVTICQWRIGTVCAQCADCIPTSNSYLRFAKEMAWRKCWYSYLPAKHRLTIRSWNATHYCRGEVKSSSLPLAKTFARKIGNIYFSKSTLTLIQLKSGDISYVGESMLFEKHAFICFSSEEYMATRRL